MISGASEEELDIANARADLLLEIQQLQQENEDLKTMVNFPSVIITTCPKCGERYSINYCREIYELEDKNKKLNNILIEFEKGLEKKKKKLDTSNDFDRYARLIIIECLDKLQELKNKKID